MSIDAANMPDWLCHSLNLPIESETLLHAFDPILEMDTVPDYWTNRDLERLAALRLWRNTFRGEDDENSVYTSRGEYHCRIVNG
ncbi:MAG: hypothetical protein EGS39_02690 [Bifidobacterium bifidum]|nr:hypothetical protein [Bifidobacterium bifidum]